MKNTILLIGVVCFFVLIIIISSSLNKDESNYVFSVLNISISILALITSLLTLYLAINIYDKFGIKEKEFYATWEVKRYLLTYTLYKTEPNAKNWYLPNFNNSIIELPDYPDEVSFIDDKDLKKIHSDLINKILNTPYFPIKLNESLNLSFLNYINIRTNRYWCSDTLKEGNSNFVYSLENGHYVPGVTLFKYIYNERSFLNCWKDLIAEIDVYQKIELNYSKPG